MPVNDPWLIDWSNATGGRVSDPNSIDWSAATGGRTIDPNSIDWGAEAWDGNPDAATIRNAQGLLNALPLPGGPLVLDGRLGPATSAKLRAFQRLVGIYETGSLNDETMAYLQNGLGYLAITGDLNAALLAGAPGASGAPGTQSGSSNLEVGGYSGDATTSAVTAALAELIENAKRVAREGGDAAQDAVAFLAEHGDLLAKIAIGVGVSYAAAQAIAIGGGLAIGFVILKVAIGRR